MLRWQRQVLLASLVLQVHGPQLGPQHALDVWQDRTLRTMAQRRMGYALHVVQERGRGMQLHLARIASVAPILLQQMLDLHRHVALAGAGHGQALGPHRVLVVMQAHGPL